MCKNRRDFSQFSTLTAKNNWIEARYQKFDITSDQLQLVGKEISGLWSTNKKVFFLILTQPKSTVRVLRVFRSRC